MDYGAKDKQYTCIEKSGAAWNLRPVRVVLLIFNQAA